MKILQEFFKKEQICLPSFKNFISKENTVILKYLYIRWKYRYDKDTRQHIYCLDRDTYGNYDDNIDDDDKILKINLYEAKISPNS